MDKPTDLMFYDGHCGLCHWLVRFTIARDPLGLFHYAPLQGELFRTTVPEAQRAALPDSVVLRPADGQLLIRSEAVLHVLRRLGGGWAVMAGVVGIVPRVVRDWCYDGIARIRHRLFKRPAEVCPVVPGELRGRFEVEGSGAAGQC